MKNQNQSSKSNMNGMFIMLALALAGSLFLQSCKKEDPGPFNTASPAQMGSTERVGGDYISLARQGCDDGTCPVYTVTVTQPANGDTKAIVDYIGFINVKTKGKVEWGVPVQELNDMQDLFKQLGFFGFKSGYVHSPLIKSLTSISMSGNVKKVSDYVKGTPAELGNLQSKFESWLNIATLVSGSSGNDNITLNRLGSADGLGPVYNLSITQDGGSATTATVKFEGIKNVKIITTSWTLDISTLQSLEQLFGELGFYSFNDEYEVSPYEESVTSINAGGKAKKVHEFIKGTPQVLQDLQSRIIDITEARSYISQ